MKKLLALSWLWLVFAPFAGAADQTFKDFVPAQPAATALAGTEVVPGVQSAATVKMTPAQLFTYSLSQLTSANVISKWSGTCDLTSFLRGDGTCATPTAGAPTNATYITQTANGSLSAEQALGALATGILKSTTTTGVLSIATLGTDYGDASTNTSSSVDSEIGLFFGTGGKTFKRSTGTGLSLLTSGVLSALAVTDDSLPLGNGTTYQVKAVPDCTDVTGNHLNYTSSTNSFSCGTTAGAGTPAGSTTQLQFNLSSAFAGDAGLTYVGSTTQKLTVGTTANAGSIRAPDGVTTGGSLTVKAGNGGGTSNGGSLTLQGGDSANSGSATSGDLILNAGIINGGNGGRLIINTGANTERFRILANGAWSVGSSGSDTGTSGQVLKSNGSAAVPTWQTNTVTPAGSDTQVQFNNAGALGADTGFTYASASDTLTLGETGTNGVLTGAADVGSSSGAVTVRTETGAAGDGSGVLTVSTGTGGSSSGTGGDLNVTAGAGGATNGAGGNLLIAAGGSPGSGTGGNVQITAGDSTSGTDGTIALRTGGVDRLTIAASGNTSQGGQSTASKFVIGSVNATLSGIGITAPATNQLGFFTNSILRGIFDSAGAFRFDGAIMSAGTKFTASGCSNGTTVGGATAGKFTSGTTGTCTVTITLPAATTDWNCMASNATTPANPMVQNDTTAHTTSCTISGTTVTGDIIRFTAIGY